MWFHQYASEVYRDFGATLKESNGDSDHVEVPHWTSLSNTFNISVVEGYWGFSSPSKFPSRLMPAGVPFGEKDGSRYPNMKELRIQHSGEPIRAFFAFDPSKRNRALRW